MPLPLPCHIASLSSSLCCLVTICVQVGIPRLEALYGKPASANSISRRVSVAVHLFLNCADDVFYILADSCREPCATNCATYFSVT